MKNKLLYAKHILDDENSLLQEIFRHQYEGNETAWVRQLKEYMNKLQLNIGQLSTLNKEAIKNHVNKWDMNMWTKEVENKHTMILYKLYKKKKLKK